MQLKTLHIVAFDVPYPANYGGVIDVFYKIKMLHENGIQIHLHLFQYGERLAHQELEKYCQKVTYYKRKRFSFRCWLPYIVATRSSAQLLHNLLQDDAPILFEAIHSSFFINHPALHSRFKMLRMHNIEHDYYNLLAHQESGLLKKIYFKTEAFLLRLYQKKIHHAQLIFAISENDVRRLVPTFGAKVFLLPAFHANTEVKSKMGASDFCFYHGKLSVAENHHAAMFLVNDVFSKIPVKLIIAGSGANTALKNAVLKYPHISLLENIGQEQINQLIADAQINVMPTFQPTGIKLKLINVLYLGRHVLVNNQMVEATGLEGLTTIVNTAKEMQDSVTKLMDTPFSNQDIQNRNSILKASFDTQMNVQQLIQFLQDQKSVIDN